MRVRSAAAFVAVLAPALAMAVALAILLGSADPVAPQSPFRDLTYEQALERACAEDRVVVLEFRAPVQPGGRKTLDPRWSDSQVLGWVEREAVAIELDLEREAVLAARLAVRWPATVVVDAQGRELGRVGRGRLLQELIFHGSREQPLERVPPEFHGDGDDPSERGRHGDALRDAGFLEEALAEYLWCWDEGLKHSQAYLGVRGSFLMSDLRELAQVLPEVRAAMESRRAAAAARVLDPGATTEEAMRVALDLTTLDQGFFEQPSRTLIEFAAVVARGDELAPARRVLASQLGDTMLEERRYDLLLVSHDDPVAGVARLARRLETRSKRRDLRPEEVENAVETGALWFEACAGVGRRDDALAIAADVLRIDARPTVHAELIQRCARAEAHELGHELVRRARETLTAEQLPSVEAAATYLR